MLFFFELNFIKFQNLLDAVRFVILVFNNQDLIDSHLKTDMNHQPVGQTLCDVLN